MESILKTDFDLLVTARAAGYDDNKDAYVINADRTTRPVKVVGYDLDRARYGNDSENAEVFLMHVRRRISEGMTAEEAVSKVYPDKWKPGDLADTPSGLGGSFTVKLKKRAPTGGWQCKVHMPRNPDWHNTPWYANDCQLREPA